MGKIDRFARALKKYKKVAVDTCVFIYVFEQEPHFGPLCKFIFSQLSKNKIQLITSSVTLTEVLVQPMKKKDWKTVNFYEDLFATLPHFSLVPIDSSVAKLAALIRSTDGFRLPDAYQLAAACKEKADVFVTNDQDLKKLKNLPILCLKDFS